MKTNGLTLFFVLFIMMLSVGDLSAQTQQDTTATVKYVVVKYDGTEFIGRIISQDAREVLIETREAGQLIIPKHVIREIRELRPDEFSATGVYIPDEVFATRYFITTNGLPIKKGESYIQWNWYGPDMQFGVGKNFGIGIMTTWVATPIIGTAKYSIKLAPKTSLGLGVLLGTGSWSMPDFKLALPFAALTFGDRKANISFSAGYGAVSQKEEVYNAVARTSQSKTVGQQRVVLSTAFMFKVGKKVSFVFDSFLVPAGKTEMVNGVAYDYNQTTGQPVARNIQYKKEKPSFAMFIPGIRWQVESNKAFQFGFAGVSQGGETLPVPIPMIQFYRKL